MSSIGSSFCCLLTADFSVYFTSRLITHNTWRCVSQSHGWFRGDWREMVAAFCWDVYHVLYNMFTFSLKQLFLMESFSQTYNACFNFKLLFRYYLACCIMLVCQDPLLQMNLYLYLKRVLGWDSKIMFGNRIDEIWPSKWIWSRIEISFAQIVKISVKLRESHVVYS